jgi:hypothetical protein
MYKLIFILLFLVFPISVFGQNRNDSADSREPSRTVFSIEETLSRNRVALAEKEHRDMIGAAGEMNYLAKTLFKTLQGQCQISSSDDQKKIEKIEKLAKKIRSEQGASGSDLANKPENLIAALDRLQKATKEIEEESHKVNRYSISTVLIQQTNEVLGLIKEIKKFKK